MLVTLRCHVDFANAVFAVRPHDRPTPVPQREMVSQFAGLVGVNLLAVKELSLDYAGGHIRMLNNDRLIIDEGPKETEELGKKFEDAMDTMAVISHGWRTELQRLLYAYFRMGKPTQVALVFRDRARLMLPPVLAMQLLTRHNKACADCGTEGNRRYERGMRIANGLPAFQ